MAAIPAQNLTPAIVVPDQTDPRYWTVEWYSHPHGGRHYDLADAQAHADRLNDAPAWDTANWLDALGIPYNESLAARGFGVGSVADMVEVA